MKHFFLYILLLPNIAVNSYAKDTGPKAPKEFIKGKLKQGQVWDHPFTMFNRNRDNSFNWQEDINLIRNEIIKFDGIKKGDIKTQTSHAFQMYYSLLALARSGEPGLCVHSVDECGHPHWVKANAFINMVGLDITTNSGGFMVVSEMTSTEYFKKLMQLLGLKD